MSHMNASTAVAWQPVWAYMPVTTSWSRPRSASWSANALRWKALERHFASTASPGRRGQGVNDARRPRVGVDDRADAGAPELGEQAAVGGVLLAGLGGVEDRDPRRGWPRSAPCSWPRRADGGALLTDERTVARCVRVARSAPDTRLPIATRIRGARLRDQCRTLLFTPIRESVSPP
jgi:hypothetical protein